VGNFFKRENREYNAALYFVGGGFKLSKYWFAQGFSPAPALALGVLSNISLEKPF